MNTIRIWRRWVPRLLYLAFYIALDAVTGVITHTISAGEPELTRGQLMIRIMTAMVLANAIVGGPDIMLYWRESGRRIAAEDERDAAVSERDAAQQKLAERDHEISELCSLIAELQERVAAQERRPIRRSRRRLRNNGR